MGMHNQGGAGGVSIQDLLGKGYDPDKAGTSPVIGQTPGGDLMIDQGNNGLAPGVQAAAQQHPYMQMLQHVLSGAARGATGGGAPQGMGGAMGQSQSQPGMDWQKILAGILGGMGQGQPQGAGNRYPMDERPQSIGLPWIR